MKIYLSSPPLLAKPNPGECLSIYLAVSKGAMSSVLIKEVDGVRRPIYYVSKRLLDAKTRYPELEKLAFTLVISSRKLRHYFLGHSIDVLTQHPFRQILRKPEVSGRLTKWSIELTQFDITYRPRLAIKVQALSDFVAEFSCDIPVNAGEASTSPPWELFVDGATSESRSGAGVLLITPEGHRLGSALRFKFKASNNEAEYEALLAGLRLALDLGVKDIKISTDSKLLVGHVTGEFTTRDPRMTAYLARAKEELARFNHWEIHHVLRTQNTSADALSKLASAGDTELLHSVQVGEIATPSITPTAHVLEITSSPSWMDPIRAYLELEQLPEGR